MALSWRSGRRGAGGRSKDAARCARRRVCRRCRAVLEAEESRPQHRRHLPVCQRPSVTKDAAGAVVAGQCRRFRPTGTSETGEKHRAQRRAGLPRSWWSLGCPARLPAFPVAWRAVAWRASTSDHRGCRQTPVHRVGDVYAHVGDGLLRTGAEAMDRARRPSYRLCSTVARGRGCQCGSSERTTANATKAQALDLRLRCTPPGTRTLNLVIKSHLL